MLLHVTVVTCVVFVAVVSAVSCYCCMQHNYRTSILSLFAEKLRIMTIDPSKDGVYI